MKRTNRFARARHRSVDGGHARVREAEAAERVLTLAEMGARGDAVGRLGPASFYAPFSLPGEEVRARCVGDRAEILEILHESPERVPAPCAHFGRCGGCQLQHWAEAPYLAWKRDQVALALKKRGVEIEVAPIIQAWGEGRRRAALHAERAGRRVALGFVERGGARIAPIDACPVLTPALQGALPAIRAVAELFAPSRGEITLAALESETGIDLNVKGAGRAGGLDRAALEAAADVADAGDLARLSLDGEPLVARRTPLLTMGEARVAPPPGAFVQATRAGEEALGKFVADALRGAERVIDLFSGCGTFALRCASFAETHAVEGDEVMLRALKAAADAAGGRVKAVTTERRDLLRTPVSALEMKRFDAVVLDPPRSGARLQAEQIGASRASRVASVSCDPPTFARDARVLIDAGFKLTRVTPIDQFRWSPHIEIVGAFER
ncbi:MAG: class I SAM-dependent RNA methyltransferase [Hyphomonadaceae bacterium]